MNLAEAGRQYQAALEAVRSHPDSDWLEVELANARRVMVTAWLEALHAEPAA